MYIGLPIASKLQFGENKGIVDTKATHFMKIRNYGIFHKIPSYPRGCMSHDDPGTAIYRVTIDVHEGKLDVN